MKAYFVNERLAFGSGISSWRNVEQLVIRLPGGVAMAIERMEHRAFLDGRRGRGRFNSNLRDEAVPLTNHGLNEARVPRIVTKDEAQLVNCCVNAVIGILESVLAPKPAINHVPADKLSVTLEQQDKQLHRDALELERVTGAA